MAKHIYIETPRLLLRNWLESDLETFAEMNADPEVMRYFPETLNAEQTNRFYESIQEEFSAYGYGLYAAEEKSSGSFMGFIGFHWCRRELEFHPSVEIGWRLDKRFWGKGYASEGAKACLEHGFEHLGFDKVISFTSVENVASQRVMQKIGLQLEGHFNHPLIPDGHPLKPHVLYGIKKLTAM